MNAKTDDIPVTMSILGDLIGYHLRRASNVVSADFADALDDTGIRQVLFAILSVVQENPGISQGLVGQHLGIQRANMVSLINELLERDLIIRRVASADRRAFELSMSPAGDAMFERCHSGA